MHVKKSTILFSVLFIVSFIFTSNTFGEPVSRNINDVPKNSNTDTRKDTSSQKNFSQADRVQIAAQIELLKQRRAELLAQQNSTQQLSTEELFSIVIYLSALEQQIFNEESKILVASDVKNSMQNNWKITDFFEYIHESKLAARKVLVNKLLEVKRKFNNKICDFRSYEHMPEEQIKFDQILVTEQGLVPFSNFYKKEFTSHAEFSPSGDSNTSPAGAAGPIGSVLAGAAGAAASTGVAFGAGTITMTTTGIVFTGPAAPIVSVGFLAGWGISKLIAKRRLYNGGHIFGNHRVSVNSVGSSANNVVSNSSINSPNHAIYNDNVSQAFNPSVVKPPAHVNVIIPHVQNLPVDSSSSQNQAASAHGENFMRNIRHVYDGSIHDHVVPSHGNNSNSDIMLGLHLLSESLSESSQHKGAGINELRFNFDTPKGPYASRMAEMQEKRYKNSTAYKQAEYKEKERQKLEQRKKQRQSNVKRTSNSGPGKGPDKDPDDDKDKIDKEKKIKENADKKARHQRFGKFYRDPQTKLWWSRDNGSNHGGPHYKVFREGAKGLEWIRDVDLLGKIMTKHKGSTGRFIPYKELIFFS